MVRLKSIIFKSIALVWRRHQSSLLGKLRSLAFPTAVRFPPLTFEGVSKTNSTFDFCQICNSRSITEGYRASGLRTSWSCWAPNKALVFDGQYPFLWWIHALYPTDHGQQFLAPILLRFWTRILLRAHGCKPECVLRHSKKVFAASH